MIFKDDDVGKDFQGLKRWVDIVLKNDANAAIGLIGKNMKDQELIEFLKSLDHHKIEIFCHGYYHHHLPYYIAKLIRSKELPKTEFNRDFKKHNFSLKKYRLDERKYLKLKAITFAPQGNIWNENVIEALVQNDFKLMFSWRKVKRDLLTIPLSENLKQNSLEEFIKKYEKNKEDIIFTLQFHHANLSEKQFELMNEVIDFLKNNEGRIFVTPSELLELSESDKNIYDLISPKEISISH